ncbi:MAG: TonB family protein [Qipengyuania sp.]
MSYTDQTRGPSSASMAAVIGVHAAIGAILVAGLTVSGTVPDIITPIDATNFPIDPPPPKPPEQTQPNPRDTVQPRPQTPVPPINVKTTETTPLPPLPLPTFPPLDFPSGKEAAKPEPISSFTPVGAKPRNDPAAWLSTDDYRPSWVRREMTGLARFRLEIAANGRVTDCTVTGSTGHGVLDTATCKLVTQRARFEPARSGTGEAVASSYSGAVLWQLPE